MQVFLFVLAYVGATPDDAARSPRRAVLRRSAAEDPLPIHQLGKRQPLRLAGHLAGRAPTPRSNASAMQNTTASPRQLAVVDAPRSALGL